MKRTEEAANRRVLRSKGV